MSSLSGAAKVGITDNASDFSYTTDAINSIQLLKTALMIAIPAIAVLVIIATLIWFNRYMKYKSKKKETAKKKKEKEQRKIKEQQKKKKEHIDKLFEDDNFLMKQVENIEEPVDKSKYHKLDLIFGTDGKVITD